MHAPKRLTALALSLAAISVASQPLEACKFEPAFGKVTSRSAVRIVDLCVDRATGSVTGPLSVDGLTLVTADIFDAEGDARQDTGVLGLFLYDPLIWE